MAERETKNERARILTAAKQEAEAKRRRMLVEAKQEAYRVAKHNARSEETRILATAKQDAKREAKQQIRSEKTRLLTVARQAAEAKAGRILSQAIRDAKGLLTESSKRSEEITRESVEEILRGAKEKAHQAREDAFAAAAHEVKAHYNRLATAMQEIVFAGDGIRSEWASKAAEPWRITASFQKNGNFPSSPPLETSTRLR